MNPTPDTTARTETAETVTVPRKPTPEMVAAGWKPVVLKPLADNMIVRVWRDMIAAAPALASPQHPVGVREALEDSTSLLASYLHFPNELTEQARQQISENRATLSRPPSQDAPGAEAIAALARGYELMQRVIWNMAGTSGPDAAWYRQQAQAVTDRVDALWKVEAGSNPSRPGDCLTQADKFLAALDPSPPLPEADGEVVAWAYEIQQHDDSWRADLSFTKPVAPYGGAIRNFEPLVRQSALVSALRERDEARARAQAMHRRAQREERLRQSIASRLGTWCEYLRGRGRETWTVSLVLRTVSNLSRFERALEAPSLRASTEEGKTATPSVKDEEAGK